MDEWTIVPPQSLIEAMVEEAPAIRRGYLVARINALEPEVLALTASLARAKMAESRVAALEHENMAMGSMLALLSRKLTHYMEMVDAEPGNHDYHRPLGKPDETTGRRTPAPDPVHERFHGAVGDVLAGKVIPAARRQMQEALKNAPKEPTAIPTAVSPDDPRRFGYR